MTTFQHTSRRDSVVGEQVGFHVGFQDGFHV
jgi:hypothetical protein